LDPWGNVYIYACPGLHHPNGFDLYSCGPDEISKSKGDDPDDINNWDPNSPHQGLGYALEDPQLPGFIFLGLGVLVVGVVWWGGRPGPVNMASLPALHRVGQILAMIWLALGLSLFLNQSGDLQVGLPFSLLWWVMVGVWSVGLVRTVAKFMSGSPTGISAGSLFVYEVVFLLWWLAIPRIA
jgi:hypothetical protein